MGSTRPVISIAEGNRSLRLSGASVVDFAGLSLIFYFGRDWEVTIANGIETLCDSCFDECDTLSSVIFEPGSRLSRIENSVFEGCSFLASICIPSSVETLGKYCFRRCRSLSTITFESDSRLLCIGWGAFSRCSSLSAICLPPRLRELYPEAFVGSNVREISIAAGNSHFKVRGSFLMDFECIWIVHYFGTEAEVTISKGVKHLGSSSFLGCPTIRSVKFDPGCSLRSIEERAFQNCSSLSSICIPSSVQVLSAHCFYECRSLSTVIFEAGSRLRRVCSAAFARCSALSSICIPSSVEILDGESFAGCDSLLTVQFESGSRLMRIETWAFGNCPKLASICVPASVQYFGGGWIDRTVVVTYEGRSQRYCSVY
jgi:hypothetical protein